MGRWGVGALEHWGTGVSVLGDSLSLLDMPFLFCCGWSILLSMPVFSWFVERLMHNGIVKMGLLAEID
jgi:hypothetical protein